MNDNSRQSRKQIRSFSAFLRLGGSLLLILLVVLAAAAMLGAEHLPLFGLSEQQKSKLFDIRLPRILLGACVGASLAVAGAGLQSLLRNPLAEPYLLGVSNGAALGTMVAFVFFQSLEVTRPVLAFVGAGLASIAVYRMAKSRAGMNVERLVLSGVIVRIKPTVPKIGKMGLRSGMVNPDDEAMFFTIKPNTNNRTTEGILVLFAVQIYHK